jgi:hypothetical protein
MHQLKKPYSRISRRVKHISNAGLGLVGAVGFKFDHLSGGHGLRDESLQGELFLLEVLRR